MQLEPPSPIQAVTRDDQNERIGWFLSLTGDETRRPTLVVAAVLTPVPEPIVSLAMRLMWGDQCIAEKPVWFATFATVDDAAVRYDWLIEHPQELEFWACHAEMSSTDELLQLIEEGVQLRQLERQEAEHAAHEEAYRAAQLATAIDTRWIEANGMFGIALHRGHDVSPFWTMLFRENWERDRFYDWWVHQNDRLADVAEFLETNSKADLEKLLLHKMLLTEQAVRKAGLGSGGRRPLRFWRGDEA